MYLKKKAILVALVLVILPSLVRVSAETSGPGQAPPPVVTVLAVTEQEVNPPTEYVGRVEAIQAVDLRARVEGYLQQVKFKEGADVREGDVLYLIEQAPYQAKVNEAKAKLAKAEATLTQARQYLQRLQTVRSGGVSATDMDAAVSAELQAKAQFQEAQASLEQAELNLGYTTIAAPVSGRIGRTSFTRGNLVGPGSGGLARIVQLHPIRAVYSMSENDFVSARMALTATTGETRDCRSVHQIRLPGGEIYADAGRLSFVDNQVDAATGTVAIRAVFDNPDGILLPGQYVTVLVACSKGKRMPTVPQSCVQEDREGRYVLVVDGENRVHQRRIKTDAVLGTHWAVASGLTAGETIIVQGIQKVGPGQIVEIVHEGRQKKE